MFKISFYLISFLLLSGINSSFAQNLKFVQITDPHIFEVNHRDKESRNSLVYFYLAIEKANDINIDLKSKGQEELDFILMSGDLGIEKLLKLEPFSKNTEAFKFTQDGEIFALVKDQEKWYEALQELTKLLQDSEVKTWLFVPGNNDIYEDQPDTIKFYKEFLDELKTLPQIKKAGIRIVDFRLESEDKITSNSIPGTYTKGNLFVTGFDNSFFKNAGSLKTFLNVDGSIKAKEQTTEYLRMSKLSETIKNSKQKYAYVFLHIPEIDDPWLAKFNADDKDDKNPVYKKIKKAESESPELAKTINPYSSWMVPDYIRQEWENIITNRNFGSPEVKGIFTGHFHDQDKHTYSGFHWLKSTAYNLEILNKLYISPTVSVKNQLSYLIDKDCARGLQYIVIDQDNGKVKRKLFWLYNHNNGH